MASLADLLKHIKETGETLSKGYPRARGFADALMANVERNVPTTQELRNPDYMQQRALNYMSPMAGAIKTYHASPHEFDRFDISKIGTGEGMQARGYGHYLSESPKFAEQFMSANNPAARHVYMVLDRFGGDIKQAIKDTSEQLKLMKKHSQYIVPEAMEKQENTLNILKAKKAGKNTDVGSIYETSIQWPDAAREAADPLGEHHLLDWDKPLNEQSEFIKNALKNSNFEYGQLLGGGKIFNIDSPVKAGHAYEDLASKLDKQKVTEMVGPNAGASKSQKFINASKHLHELGVPGIKYSTNDITNYVMFGDEYPQIVNRAGSLADLLKGKK